MGDAANPLSYIVRVRDVQHFMANDDQNVREYLKETFCEPWADTPHPDDCEYV